MTNEEKMAVMKRWERTFQDMLPPLLATGDDGLVALRMYYVVRQADGTMSGGQTGMVTEDMQGQADSLVMSMVVQMMLGLVDDTTSGRADIPAKS